MFILLMQCSYGSEKTRQDFRPRYVVLAIVEFSETFLGTITTLHQKKEHVAQALLTFQRFRQDLEPPFYGPQTKILERRKIGG